MTDYTGLRLKLRIVQETLDSPLLSEVIMALTEHPNAVSEAALEEARKNGALAVLRDLASYNPVRQAGHPEEETREFDNIDLRQIARRAGILPGLMWAGHEKWGRFR